MERSDLKKDIETFEDPKLRRVLLELYGNLMKKDNVIISLQNRLSELEKRVVDNENYTSKDCLIFENMPRTTDGRPLPLHVCCEFLKVFLNYNTQPANFKACHLLGKGNGRYPPAVILVNSCTSRKKVKYIVVSHGWPETRIPTMVVQSLSKSDSQNFKKNSKIMLMN